MLIGTSSRNMKRGLLLCGQTSKPAPNHTLSVCLLAVRSSFAASSARKRHGQNETVKVLVIVRRGG